MFSAGAVVMGGAVEVVVMLEDTVLSVVADWLLTGDEAADVTDCIGKKKENLRSIDLDNVIHWWWRVIGESNSNY